MPIYSHEVRGETASYRKLLTDLLYHIKFQRVQLPTKDNK
jgi:hypothetical protein